MRAWIDVDTPPQVQYLLPFRRAFEAAGDEVVVTARDFPGTLELLQATGASYDVVGAHPGSSRARKVAATLGRAARLTARLRSRRPDVLLCASRSSALAASFLRAPSFVVCDYEHVHLEIYRRIGSFLLFPESIPAQAFLDKGFRRERLLPFRGIKEHITFSAVDLDAVQPHRFPELDGDESAVVLLRPPAERSHYYAGASGDMTLALLRRLAARDDVAVVLSPRYPEQVQLLDAVRWQRPPIALRRPVPFLPLLKAVDAVVTAGGTMAREAAFLGVPSYSILQSEIGGVDRYLESIGRLTHLRTQDDLDAVRVERRDGLDPLPGEPGLLGEIVARVRERAA